MYLRGLRGAGLTYRSSLNVLRLLHNREMDNCLIYFVFCFSPNTLCVLINTLCVFLLPQEKIWGEIIPH